MVHSVLIQLTTFWSFTGDLVYITVFGSSMIIVNTYEAAKELLERRSSIYSDRPRLELFDMYDLPIIFTPAHNHCSGWAGEMLPPLCDSKASSWPTNLLNHVKPQWTTVSEASSIHPSGFQSTFCFCIWIYAKETSPLTYQRLPKVAPRLHETFVHVKFISIWLSPPLICLSTRFSTATILKATYGRDVTSSNDQLLVLCKCSFLNRLQEVTLTLKKPKELEHLFHNLVHQVQHLLISSQFLGQLSEHQGSSFTTYLRHIPTWAPFAGFKRKALFAREAVESMKDIPYQMVKDGMVSGC